MKRGSLIYAAVFCLLFFACTHNEKRDLPCYLPEIDPSCNVEYIFEDFDCYFRFQGYLNYSGKYGLSDFEEQGSIDIRPAWEITKGAGAKIAVFDEQIQKNHEEFGKISVWNVINGSSSVEPVNKKEYSHGTAVSGIIAAQVNEKGITGIAPESDFLFMGNSYEADDKDVIKAFEYARNWGAKVISCSWGSYDASSTFESLMKEFYDDGITVIFASGNDYMDLDNKREEFGTGKDESEIEWVIGVSASNGTGEKAKFSNYGSKIDIMAPGTSILTLDLMSSAGSNNAKPYANNNYVMVNGTSFSAPVVAGVAALMLSVNPSLTPQQIRQIIIDTAEKNGFDYDGNGFSLYNAYGLVNAGRAIKTAAGIIE